MRKSDLTNLWGQDAALIMLARAGGCMSGVIRSLGILLDENIPNRQIIGGCSVPLDRMLLGWISDAEPGVLPLSNMKSNQLN